MTVHDMNVHLADGESLQKFEFDDINPLQDCEGGRKSNEGHGANRAGRSDVHQGLADKLLPTVRSGLRRHR